VSDQYVCFHSIANTTAELLEGNTFALAYQRPWVERDTVLSFAQQCNSTSKEFFCCTPPPPPRSSPLTLRPFNQLLHRRTDLEAEERCIGSRIRFS